MEQGGLGSVLKDPKEVLSEAPKVFVYKELWASEKVDFWMKTIALQPLHFSNCTVSAHIKTPGNDEGNCKWERNNDCRNTCLSQTKELLLSQACLQWNKFTTVAEIA